MKLGVCVPYRNREEHMNQFVPHVSKFLTERGIEPTPDQQGAEAAATAGTELPAAAPTAPGAGI